MSKYSESDKLQAWKRLSGAGFKFKGWTITNNKGEPYGLDIHAVIDPAPPTRMMIEDLYVLFGGNDE